MTALGHTIEFELNEDATVSELYSRIQGLEKYSREQQQLSFDGTKLIDEARTLQSYGIKDGSNIELLIITSEGAL